MLNSNTSRIRRTALFLAGQLLLLLPLTNLTLGQTQPSTVPRLVKFSGSVNAVHGSPRSGVMGLTFTLYKDENGGVPLWLETQNAALDASGHYTVQLGATLPDGLPQELFASGEARWLGVQPEGQAEQPRVLLLSVPYALKAGDAETLGGLPLSAFVLAAPQAASPGAAAGASAIPGTSAPPPNAAVTGAGVVNFLPLWDTTSDIVTSAISQTGSGTTAKIGINNTAPTSTLDVKGSTTVRGTLTLPPTSAATATAGKASQPLNLIGSAFNSGTATAVSQTFRLQAEPVGNNTASPSGKLDLLYYAGANTAAETGLSIASNGQITFSAGQLFPGTGNGTITGVTAGSGLIGGGTSGNISLSLPMTCATSQILKWTGSTWACSADSNSGGTIRGLTAGTALTGGGTSGTVTLNLDTTQVPLLNTANTFTGNQAVLGNVSSNGIVSGSDVNALNSFDIRGSAFAFGSQNTANSYFGFAGNQTGTGGDNVGTGQIALLNNTTGNENTANGVAALKFNAGGSNNSAVGYFALSANTTGSNNTALGANAGPDSAHPSLSNSTAIGANAQVTTSNALVLGSINGVNGATADTLVGIGTTAPAAKLDVHGTANFTGLVTFASGQTFPGTGTITGVTAGTGLTGGGTSGGVTLNVDTTKVVTAITAGSGLTGGGAGGVQTLTLDATKVPLLASANTFTGNQTVNGNVSATGVVTGSSFQIGPNLFGFGTIANGNAFLGFAGNTTMTGKWNTATGEGSFFSDTTGEQNTAYGADILPVNTTGSLNTAIGRDALHNNTTGTNNTALGQLGLYSNTTGSGNTSVGGAVLDSNNTGNSNTAVGEDSMNSNVSGSGNTASGFFSMENNISGSANSALGYLAGPDALTSNLINSTAIGAFADVSESNALVLGSINGVNGSGADTNVGIGTTAPQTLLHIDHKPPFGGQDVLLLTTGGTADVASLALQSTVAGGLRLREGVGTGSAYLSSTGGMEFITSDTGNPTFPSGKVMSIDTLGNVHITGNLSKGGGSFKIDHPLDPANKYLYHSFVESPDMMNIYNGVATLDARGAVWITLPDYFGALNRDFRYQLTSMGRPQPELYIAKEISGSRFRIAGGKPGGRVSWQVTGIRQDAYANAHRIPVEEDKPAQDQGHYLHPELFGAAPELAIGTHPAAAGTTHALVRVTQ